MRWRVSAGRLFLDDLDLQRRNNRHDFLDIRVRDIRPLQRADQVPSHQVEVPRGDSLSLVGAKGHLPVA